MGAIPTTVMGIQVVEKPKIGLEPIGPTLSVIGEKPLVTLLESVPFKLSAGDEFGQNFSPEHFRKPNMPQGQQGSNNGQTTPTQGTQ